MHRPPKPRKFVLLHLVPISQCSVTNRLTHNSEAEFRIEQFICVKNTGEIFYATDHFNPDVQRETLFGMRVL